MSASEQERGVLASSRTMTIFFPQRRFMDRQWPREVITRLLPYSIFAPEERDGTIASLKADLATANGELDKWRNLFQSGESILPENSTSDPRLILDHIKSLQASQARVKDQLASSRRKETAMLIHLSNKEQEIAEMKTLVHDLKLSLRPPTLQSRRLLLDPAIHVEFTRMKKELEIAEKKAKDLTDDLAAVQFTPHSKNGKMLMAKCRTLQEENEEIGREASEGKIHDLETRLAVQKSLSSELKRGYQELFRYVRDLNEEAERLQQMVRILQSQVEQKDWQTA
ncbi:FKBP12-interacting protein of 37 kDa isoform X2 [Selaginella moellendorffii]|uniref:FKBP12-interacting protein of 37 kDa isoform X2 n=1 Tax=Selaginella moellendorffii TaxID=88036 RepID=UPI000D1CE2F5|nr:FKBP12-interacting protein of 37 kDa isoform X2 [Selaginella moellendorffii]|eukprot:XP_024514738.1 FKBP12-interacting protein of 37 kDa isoform X2 [Selaginella moellendorffii]